MAKTFEALMKAEKENQIRPEEAKVLDRKPKSKPHAPAKFKSSPRVIEEYHRMKHHILSSNPENQIKTLLFFSSTDGEGTSTVIANFAINLASKSDKVLLVDANLRNPSLHDLFNVEKKGGITELLLEENTLKDVVKQTEHNNLSVITSGIPHSNPFSLFESKSLDSLIERMKNQADWVLFDSPSINSYNDAPTLAVKMDGAVMVVQAEKTRWEVALNARKRLENSKVNVLGVVLNRRKMYIPGWVYKML